MSLRPEAALAEPARVDERAAGGGEQLGPLHDARALHEFCAVLVKELGHRARGAAGDLLEGVGGVVVLAGED